MPDAPALPLADTIIRLGLATLLGALVGLERERLERSAGVRTHAIVALGAALIMLVSMFGFSDVLGSSPDIHLDVSRVAAQVVSGIGFLGAGVIIFRQSAVRGLTTAASIWTVAGLGLACGGGLFAAAGIATGFILALQLILRPIEQRIFTRQRDHALALQIRRNPGSLATIERAVQEAGASIRCLRVQPMDGGQDDRVDITLDPIGDAQAARLVERLRDLAGTQLIAYTMGTEDPDALRR